jgi:histidinol-phosphate aminotransferase
MRRRRFVHHTLASAATAAAGLATATVDPLRALAPAAGADPSGPLRLNSNENPLGPSARARHAIVDGLAEANRYTHPLVPDVRSRLARLHGVDEAAIVLGNGSTEVLRMAVQAMAGPAGWAASPTAGPTAGGPVGGARLVLADPTFEHVEDYAQPWSLDLVKVPLGPGHAHDIGRMRDAVAAGHRPGLGARRPVLVYICNPNNPTGSLTPVAEVEAWIREAPEDLIFLVDEAYLEYVEDASYRSVLPLAVARPNVVVVRTFSKVHGLAGLRLGYGLAEPGTARRIAAFSGRSNLNAFALLAAAAALDDAGAHVRASLAANIEARRLTEALLDELGLERVPTQANFIMHRVPGDLRAYIARMREAGVWVGRPFPPMTGHNRLSLGTPAEMARFGEVLRGFRRRGWV